MLWRSQAPARRPAGFIEPCRPTLARTVSSGRHWAHVISHDGYRFICRRDGDRVRVFSQRG
jgi:ATP-dependent DNA ligase